MTLPGTTLGSVHYFSPEQARGDQTTPSSDIFSLGIVLFELLTGHRPWEADTAAAVAMARLVGPAAGPDGAPRRASRPISSRSTARRSPRSPPIAGPSASSMAGGARGVPRRHGDPGRRRGSGRRAAGRPRASAGACGRHERDRPGQPERDPVCAGRLRRCRLAAASTAAALSSRSTPTTRTARTPMGVWAAGIAALAILADRRLPRVPPPVRAGRHDRPGTQPGRRPELRRQDLHRGPGARRRSRADGRAGRVRRAERRRAGTPSSPRTRRPAATIDPGRHRQADRRGRAPRPSPCRTSGTRPRPTRSTCWSPPGSQIGTKTEAFDPVVPAGQVVTQSPPARASSSTRARRSTTRSRRARSRAPARARPPRRRPTPTPTPTPTPAADADPAAGAVTVADYRCVTLADATAALEGDGFTLGTVTAQPAGYRRRRLGRDRAVAVTGPEAGTRDADRSHVSTTQPPSPPAPDLGELSRRDAAGRRRPLALARRTRRARSGVPAPCQLGPGATNAVGRRARRGSGFDFDPVAAEAERTRRVRRRTAPGTRPARADPRPAHGWPSTGSVSRSSSPGRRIEGDGRRHVLPAGADLVAEERQTPAVETAVAGPRGDGAAGNGGTSRSSSRTGGRPSTEKPRVGASRNADTATTWPDGSCGRGCCHVAGARSRARSERGRSSPDPADRRSARSNARSS